MGHILEQLFHTNMIKPMQCSEVKNIHDETNTTDDYIWIRYASKISWKDTFVETHNGQPYLNEWWLIFHTHEWIGTTVTAILSTGQFMWGQCILKTADIFNTKLTSCLLLKAGISIFLSILFHQCSILIFYASAPNTLILLTDSH